jgi:hypothetical protein
MGRQRPGPGQPRHGHVADSDSRHSGWQAARGPAAAGTGAAYGWAGT